MVAARSEIFTVNFLVYYKNSFLTLVHSLLASSGAFPNVPKILSTGALVPRCLILDPNLASFLWYLVRLGKFPSAAAGRQQCRQWRPKFNFPRTSCTMQPYRQIQRDQVLNIFYNYLLYPKYSIGGARPHEAGTLSLMSQPS